MQEHENVPCPKCGSVCIREQNPDGSRYSICAHCNAEIVNPGDMYGRTLAASEIELARDGNLVSALAGEDLVIGVSGFGTSVHDALVELAENLVNEAVWVEVLDGETIDLGQVIPAGSGTIQAEFVSLYRLDEGRTCAFVGSNHSKVGLFGIGPSVHEAVLALAQSLVTQGVWIEVTTRREWHFEELSGEDPLSEDE